MLQFSIMIIFSMDGLVRRLGWRLLAGLSTCLSCIFALAQDTAVISSNQNGPRSVTVLREIGEVSLHPMTSVPAVGALAIMLSGKDKSIARWAHERHPVFGSPKEARAWSEKLKLTLMGEALVTWAFLPKQSSGPGMAPIWANGASMVLSTALSLGAGAALKRGIGRERPNGIGLDSFPSAHSAMSMTHATQSNIHLSQLPISDTSAAWWQAGNWTTASMVGLARMEAGVHHPVDVLAGLALGHWLTQLTYRLLQAKPGRQKWWFGVETQLGPEKDVQAELSYLF